MKRTNKIITFIKFFLPLLLFFNFFHVKGQDNFYVVLNPTFAVGISNETRWYFHFGIDNQDLIYGDDQWILTPKQISVSAFGNYLIGTNSFFGLGLEYKSRNIFDEKIKDEQKITLQYGVFKKYKVFKIENRFRFEEHLKVENSYRTRYRFQMEFPLVQSQIYKNSIFLILNTEVLWAISKNISPNFGVWTGSSLAYKISDHLRATFCIQYRYENYTHIPITKFFIQNGMSLSL
jgi:hypothetical protein